MIIPVTSLVFKEGTDGKTDALEKTEGGVNTDNIEQFHRGTLKKDVPIIGEENETGATFIMFRSGRNIAVVETPEQLFKLANPSQIQ